MHFSLQSTSSDVAVVDDVAVAVVGDDDVLRIARKQPRLVGSNNLDNRSEDVPGSLVVHATMSSPIKVRLLTTGPLETMQFDWDSPTSPPLPWLPDLPKMSPDYVPMLTKGSLLYMIQSKKEIRVSTCPAHSKINQICSFKKRINVVYQSAALMLT